MRKVNSISIIILLLAVTAESRGQKQADNNDLIKVDVTKSYSSKKELILQDFMDVEYIALETTDNFVNQGWVQAIGKKIILVTNRTVNNGDIFIYNRAGKALRRINHKGYGGEEYTNILGITLDEDSNEMFVNDIFTRKILVYDLYGKFKRSFNHKVSAEKLTCYTAISNYDRNNLLCCDEYNEVRSFILISKKDGSITKEIKIPFEKKILFRQNSQNGTKYYSANPGFYHRMIPFNGNWILLEHSSDIIYTFLPDYSLCPFIRRTPPIQSMDSRIFLVLSCFFDRYIFMETIKNVYDFDTKSGFPRTFFMYDRQEKTMYNYTVYNGDYSIKKEIYMNNLRTDNNEIGSWQSLEAYQLVEDYKKGILKGKLKEIASKLNEESNPVIMLIKHKK